MKRLQFYKADHAPDNKLRRWIFNVLLQHNKVMVSDDEIVKRYMHLIEMHTPAERKRIHKRLSDMLRTTVMGMKALGDALSREK